MVDFSLGFKHASGKDGFIRQRSQTSRKKLNRMDLGSACFKTFWQ